MGPIHPPVCRHEVQTHSLVGFSSLWPSALSKVLTFMPPIKALIATYLGTVHCNWKFQGFFLLWLGLIGKVSNNFAILTIQHSYKGGICSVKLVNMQLTIIVS